MITVMYPFATVACARAGGAGARKVCLSIGFDCSDIPRLRSIRRAWMWRKPSGYLMPLYKSRARLVLLVQVRVDRARSSQERPPPRYAAPPSWTLSIPRPPTLSVLTFAVSMRSNPGILRSVRAASPKQPPLLRWSAFYMHVLPRCDGTTSLRRCPCPQVTCQARGSRACCGTPRAYAPQMHTKRLWVVFSKRLCASAVTLLLTWLTLWRPAEPPWVTSWG